MLPRLTGRRRLLFFVITGSALVTIVALLAARPKTDTDTIEQNRFSAGTVELTTAPTAAVVSYADMLPGDEIIRPLVVANKGTGDLRYSLRGTASGGSLIRELTIEIREARDERCLPLTGVALAEPTSVAAFGFGAAAVGADPGDRVLPAGDSEILCIAVRLPLSTDNGLQGELADLTFTFDAEQVKNNP